MNQQTKEAVQRLKILQNLGFPEKIVNQYKNKQQVFLSKRTGKIAALYPIKAYPQFVEIIQYYEQQQNALVYHAMHERTDYGEILELFYVSCYKKDWTGEKFALQQKEPSVYTVNLTNPEQSENKTICIEIARGIIRTI